MIDFRNKNIKIDPKYLERDPNKQYVACISYGKDSLAMLEVIKNYVLMCGFSGNSIQCEIG